MFFTIQIFSVVLDGVNLNIVMGGSEGYKEFVSELRRIEKEKGMDRHTSISVATQCFFPDSRMGPGPDQGEIL